MFEFHLNAHAQGIVAFIGLTTIIVCILIPLALALRAGVRRANAHICYGRTGRQG